MAKLFSDILKETVGGFMAASYDCAVEEVALTTCESLQAAAVVDACVTCITATPTATDCGDLGPVCAAMDACEEGMCGVCGNQLDHDYMECLVSPCSGCDDSQGSSSVSWI